MLDEPTASLDVETRASIWNLLNKLRRDLGLTYVVISHDFSTVRMLCDHVGVMYYGRLVETGSVATVWDNPQHAYTKSLLAAELRVNSDSSSAND